MDTTPAPDKGDFARLNEVTLAEAPSWGERLLPYLFAAMETCWIDAILIGIASLSFSSGNPLVPLWSPFVFIAGLYWLVMSREQQASTGTSSFSSIFVGAILVVSILLTLWFSVYAASFSLLDLRWLGSILNDLLLLGGNAFHIIFVLLILAYFSWRGVRLSRNALEPGSVSNTLRIGLFVLLAAILLRALNRSQANELTLLLLVPLFLAFVLVAHSLAQAALLRRSHPGGLQGSIKTQENSLLAIIAIIGVVLLLVSLLIGAVASPAFLTQMQNFLSPVATAYDWLAHAIAYIATLIVTPLFWLIQALHLHSVGPTVKPTKQPPSISKHVNNKPTDTSAITSVFVTAIEIALPILLILLIIFMVRLVLRRRRIRLTHRQEDQHESLWSWSLFWTQVRAFLTGLFSRFFPSRHNAEQRAIEDELTGEPAARSIREIYRALLRWSAARGIARKRAETPYEFRARLDKRLPLAEPELSVVTEAYTATRYGPAVPDEREVARVREAWTQLQQRQFPS